MGLWPIPSDDASDAAAADADARCERALIVTTQVAGM